MQLINVVNENETKWTHFRLIIHPAQVERSGVWEGNARELQTCWATVVN